MLTSDLCTQHSLSPGNASFGPWFLFTEFYSRLVQNATSLEILPSSSSSGYCGLNSQINSGILYNALEDLGMCLLFPLFQIERSFYTVYFILLCTYNTNKGFLRRRFLLPLFQLAPEIFFLCIFKR